MLLHVLHEQMLVLVSGVANVTNKTVWAITCVLVSFVVCHIISVHWFVVTKITFKVRNHFGSMRFHLMIFKGGICSKRLFAHYTLLCLCVLVFDMSTVGAWCQNFLANITSFLFDYLRIHLIFSLVCNIDGRPPRCQMCCRSRSWRSVDGNMFLQLLRRSIEGAFWTIGSHFDVAWWRDELGESVCTVRRNLLEGKR